MFNKLEFIRSAHAIDQFDKSGLPEVLFCGRSNVGKSSLINTLLNRKNFAKTSSTPGKTRSVNYFLIDEKFKLVDLPGYGYAKTSFAEREKWAKLVKDYLSNSDSIELAFHLIDSRHKPTELDDKLNLLLKSSSITYIVILNKVDKLNQSQLATAKKRIIEHYPELNFGDNLYIFSSVTKKGRKELMSLLNKLFYNS
ncbi:MAG: YihA family ribosome biogenesis GTP-binding protein [Ignavibacteriales bacterium CG_4_9_14_3_um_filter_30_11]|nr:MAG: YihA family ribosome biogenesis GTP-binding protein [Ignavibacteriales bacterium CG_4_9_14_3_um_filter_30_11]